MYRADSLPPTPPENFELPFEGKLSEDNRWVIMANLIPWEEFEQEYARNFSEEMGAPAKPFRMALGALIIKERLGVSDRETVEQIKENPYLQYFIGLSSYSDKAPFEASMLVHFRQRITVDLVAKINRKMILDRGEIPGAKPEEKKPREPEEISEKKNRGKLIADATCAPADIRYPTDLGLLNEAREKTEEIIDRLYEPIQDQFPEKPRTYREKARKDYLEVAKKRRPSSKQIRKAVRKQLQYIQRNLAHIDRLIQAGASLSWLSKKLYRSLLIIAELFRQQVEMFADKKRSIENRIVSLTQPHIRPIVRGKAGRPVEFGAKLSVSCLDGYVFLDHLSWENFNESIDLKDQIEEFKNFTGFYPESVHVDQIYRTRENRAYCRERGIRMSGPPLGRPPANLSKEDKKQSLEDERIRNSIEGKFGQAKRRFSLARVMTKLPSTSETAIAITFLELNLSSLLRQVLSLFFGRFSEENTLGRFLGFFIKKTYPFPNCFQQNLSFQLA